MTSWGVIINLTNMNNIFDIEALTEHKPAAFAAFSLFEGKWVYPLVGHEFNGGLRGDL